jgi:hypothetical protein
MIFQYFYVQLPFHPFFWLHDPGAHKIMHLIKILDEKHEPLTGLALVQISITSMDGSTSR